MGPMSNWGRIRKECHPKTRATSIDNDSERDREPFRERRPWLQGSAGCGSLALLVVPQVAPTSGRGSYQALLETVVRAEGAHQAVV